MSTTCLFLTSTFTFQPKKTYCSVKPCELDYVELGIWFQMIAPAHAYALYKHEKAW